MEVGSAATSRALNVERLSAEHVRYARSVLGEKQAIVVDVRPFDVHGVAYVDVTVTYRDRSVETARLGRESVPEAIVAGDEVVVRTAANMVVAIERSPG